MMDTQENGHVESVWQHEEHYPVIITDGGPRLIVAEGDVAQVVGRINVAAGQGDAMVLLPLFIADPFDLREPEVEHTGVAIDKILLVTNVHKTPDEPNVEVAGGKLVVPRAAPII